MSEEGEASMELLVPEVTPSESPSFNSSAIMRLQRKPDQVSLSGTRRRVFAEKSGLIMVDKELMDELGLGDVRNNDDTEEDSGDFTPAKNSDDEARLKENRLHATRVIAHTQMSKALGQQTPSSRKVSRVIQHNNITHEDQLERMEMDDHNLVSMPCVSPKTNLLHSYIGKNVDDSDCYACSRGLHVARVDHAVIIDLRTLITELMGSASISEVVTLVSEHFETNIRSKFNSNLRPGEGPIPPWSPKSVYEHLIFHAKEGSFIHSHMLDILLEHLQIVHDQQVYKTSIEAARSGRALSNADIKVVDKGHRQLLQTIKGITDLLSKKPQDMANYNPALNIVGRHIAAIAPKAVDTAVKVTKSIYDNPDVEL